MRVSVADTAKVMGTTCLTVQCLMRKGLIDIGDVLPSKHRRTYIIHSAKLASHVGITEQVLLQQIENL